MAKRRERELQKLQEEKLLNERLEEKKVSSYLIMQQILLCQMTDFRHFGKSSSKLKNGSWKMSVEEKQLCRLVHLSIIVFPYLLYIMYQINDTKKLKKLGKKQWKYIRKADTCKPERVVKG